MVQLSFSNCVAEISTLYVGVALVIYYAAVPAHETSRTKTRRKKKSFQVVERQRRNHVCSIFR